MHGFWLVEELVLLANEPTGCGEVGGGGGVSVICLERQGVKVSCTYRGLEKD